MKSYKYISHILLGSALLLGYSCSPDDDLVQQTSQDDPHANDEYYVRYSGSARTAMHSSVAVDCYYSDTDGKDGEFHGKGFNTTIGPVKYGFTAKLTVTGGFWQTARIEISKNNGPFTQKGYSTSGRASYTIDF